MIDEGGLEFCQNGHILFDRQRVLRLAGIEGGEGLLGHLAGKGGQGLRTRTRGEDKELSVV
jgi:hypothetical protein